MNTSAAKRHRPVRRVSIGAPPRMLRRGPTKTGNRRVLVASIFDYCIHPKKRDQAQNKPIPRWRDSLSRSISPSSQHRSQGALLIQVNVYWSVRTLLATSTYREVVMSSLKVMIRLAATMTLLSMVFALYPQGSANAARYCAELRGATATGHPDCSYTSHSACRKAVRAGGGGHCYKLRA